MVKDLDSSAQQLIDQQSNIIYEYLRHYAAIQTPQAVIKEFRTLFLQGKNEDRQVSQALEKIIFSSVGQQQFNEIFNNCFYFILDCWSSTPQSFSYLSELIGTLDLINQAKSYDRRRKHLIQLIKDYQQTELYFQLRAIIIIINPEDNNKVRLKNTGAINDASDTSDTANNSSDSTINNYLGRYTYLYEYFLPHNLEVSQLSRLKEFLQTQQKNCQQEFEIKLSKHIIYRFRLKQLARMKLLSKGAGKIITKVNNPSLLSERAFKVALQQYLGKIDSNSGILERSQRFVANNNLRNSYQVFKKDLHGFLISNIQPRNSNYQFSSKLEEKLEQIFPQSNGKPLNKTLILQTCRQLLSFLIVDRSSSTDPTNFAELIVNLGTAQLMIILIKITLICPESKADLERKISLIVSYYQLYSIQDTPWLIKTLEHLLIAFSIYFGNIDVSIATEV